jgi:hypothetical protein
VYRAVLTDTLQHPATILPAAAAAIGGLYLGVISLDPAAFAVTFGSALVAAGAWIYNYFIRGEALAEKHVESLRDKRHRLRLDQATTLAAEWAETGYREGIQQAQELGEAYRKLEAFLAQRFAERKGSGLDVQRLMVLAEDTYREGVAILRRGLDIYRALRQVDRDKLEGELEAWRAELAELGAKTSPNALEKTQAGSLETRIAAHERRLELHGAQTRSLAQLIAQSEELEAALESTYLEAADLATTDALFTRGHAAEELERAVTAARRVEQRLRAMNEPRKEDEIYLTAAQRPD